MGIWKQQGAEDVTIKHAKRLAIELRAEATVLLVDRGGPVLTGASYGRTPESMMAAADMLHRCKRFLAKPPRALTNDDFSVAGALVLGGYDVERALELVRVTRGISLVELSLICDAHRTREDAINRETVRRLRIHCCGGDVRW